MIRNEDSQGQLLLFYIINSVAELSAMNYLRDYFFSRSQQLSSVLAFHKLADSLADLVNYAKVVFISY